MWCRPIAGLPAALHPAAAFFVGCTAALGFDFADFELANTKELLDLYPQHTGIIKELCR
ncbi:hypothetical protein [Ferruginibacter sp.]